MPPPTPNPESQFSQSQLSRVSHQSNWPPEESLEPSNPLDRYRMPPPTPNPESQISQSQISRVSQQPEWPPEESTEQSDPYDRYRPVSRDSQDSRLLNPDSLDVSSQTESAVRAPMIRQWPNCPMSIKGQETDQITSISSFDPFKTRFRSHPYHWHTNTEFTVIRKKLRSQCTFLVSSIT